MTGFVYFIQGGPGEPIKIGFTADVRRRMRALQTAYPKTLNLLAHMHASRKIEAAIHQRLADYRLAGEWFEDCPAVQEEIKIARRDWRTYATRPQPGVHVEQDAEAFEDLRDLAMSEIMTEVRCAAASEPPRVVSEKTGLSAEYVRLIAAGRRGLALHGFAAFMTAYPAVAKAALRACDIAQYYRENFGDEACVA